MSTIKVFKEFHEKLVTMLPVYSTVFLSKLYSCDLLPDNLMDEIKAERTPADKAMCFLHGKIRCDISNGDVRSFNKLLDIMEKSGNTSLKDLAKDIKTAMDSVSTVFNSAGKNQGVEHYTLDNT